MRPYRFTLREPFAEWELEQAAEWVLAQVRELVPGEDREGGDQEIA